MDVEAQPLKGGNVPSHLRSEKSEDCYVNHGAHALDLEDTSFYGDFTSVGSRKWWHTAWQGELGRLKMCPIFRTPFILINSRFFLF